jgi:mRNA interferase MazF
MAQDFRFGEIVIVEYPYSDGIRSKYRPALVLTSHADGDLLLARITTKPPVDPYDIALTGWLESKLMAPSCVRLTKLSTLLDTRAKSKIGILSDADRKNVLRMLRSFIESIA